VSRASQHELLERMRKVVDERAGSLAVREDGRAYTYAELGSMIERVNTGLTRVGLQAGEPVGLLLGRSALAYAAMWAAISHGSAYVPLNTSFPRTRLRNIVEQAAIRTVVCDERTRDMAEALGLDTARVVMIASDGCSADAAAIERRWWQARAGGSVAYVMFTSGSTGEPKGVPISYGNLVAFVDNMHALIEYRPDDVCSQVCELSFDFSVHEIYLALLNGCTLCPARPVDLFNPAHYAASRAITVWIAVPSLSRVILNNGIPVGDKLERIRVSIFNGEALTSGLAAAWHAAAPNAEIWNSYGPTECTVAVTAQRWSADPQLAEADVVAIGTPFPDCRAALLDGARLIPTRIAPDGSVGELLLDTPQRFSGYTDSRLASPFVSDGDGAIYYRTGDLVRWRGGKLYHLGRIDHQVKIGGHRIELLEIEYRLRRCLGTESLAVIAYPSRHPSELVLLIATKSGPPKLEAESLGLPAYMLPTRTIMLDALPTNPHGKLDRVALQSIAEAQT
jgi:D-alanine--poly(phosphoribitol) ligase subunit 1